MRFFDPSFYGVSLCYQFLNKHGNFLSTLPKDPGIIVLHLRTQDVTGYCYFIPKDFLGTDTYSLKELVNIYPKETYIIVVDYVDIELPQIIFFYSESGEEIAIPLSLEQPQSENLN